MLQRLTGRVGAMTVVAASLVGCTASDDIRTVADFDANPCALFTEKSIQDVISVPYKESSMPVPTLKSAEADETDDSVSCVYTFDSTAIAAMKTFTVTVSHMQAGNQPLAMCEAGATTRAEGYRLQDEIGDLACTTPSSDLWMRIGQNYFHVVVVAQPGFSNPVERSQILSPVLLAVSKGAAERMPAS